MVFPESGTRTRVNGATLTQHTGCQVVLLGEVNQMDSSGKVLTVKASDGQSVQVILQQPAQEILEGLIEIHGVVEGRQVICQSYITFPLDDARNFDMQSYDQAVRLIHTVKDNPWKSD
ncbi:replication protein A 14 kDa subunit [Cherax quadricarinatus]|nr:replication protein A 14 kDa subunit-like [Cherax quadricarinatus]